MSSLRSEYWYIEYQSTLVFQKREELTLIHNIRSIGRISSYEANQVDFQKNSIDEESLDICIFKESVVNQVRVMKYYLELIFNWIVNSKLNSLIKTVELLSDWIEIRKIIYS